MFDERIAKTINVYDEIYEEYAKTNESVSVVKEFLDYFIENVNGKVLDAGCGHGRDAKYLSEHGLEVTGIDLSEKLLEIARNNAPKALFYNEDMMNSSFKDNSYDGLWACGSFLHIPGEHSKQTLNEFCRVLKKNGLMFICVKQGSREGFYKDLRYGDKERFFKNYSVSDFKELIEDAGFRIINGKVERGWINYFALKE